MDSKVHSLLYHDTCLDSFQSLTNKPETFLGANAALANTIRQQLKAHYDFAKSEEIKTIVARQQSNALPTLIIENFDVEQVWQQIELQNNALLTAQSLETVSKLIVAVRHQQPPPDNDNRVEDMSLGSENGGDDDDDSSEEDEEEEAAAMAEADNSDDEIVEEDLEDGTTETNSDNTRHRTSVVDDDFFKLDEMERFLAAEDKKFDAEQPDSGNDSEEEDDEEEESVDLFDMPDNDEDVEDDKMKTARFKDFFVANNELVKKSGGRNKLMEELDRDDEEEDLEEKIDGGDDIKSTFELRQERLSRKIDRLEESAVGEKSWQLKGEITAENRPQNSLLEEIVDFDLTSRPAPVITEQTTLQLEDIIRQRIKDKVFDSVVRKIKPVADTFEYKKKLVLDQEKSKQSLAQIYEKDYLDQKALLDPDGDDDETKADKEEPQLHKDINVMQRTLFSKLDALSNFHFTPKAAAPELRIVSNLPAVSMEEVAPIAVSDAALLAPEEIKTAKTNMLGKSERTDTDKKRERRKKKQKQKIHAKINNDRKKKMNEINPGMGNKYGKEKAKKMLDGLVKNNRNVDLMDESSVKVKKSSTAFFTSLQEEVATQVRNRTDKKTEKKNTFNAKKMKF